MKHGHSKVFRVAELKKVVKILKFDHSRWVTAEYFTDNIFVVKFFFVFEFSFKPRLKMTWKLNLNIHSIDLNHGTTNPNSVWSIKTMNSLNLFTANKHYLKERRLIHAIVRFCLCRSVSGGANTHSTSSSFISISNLLPTFFFIWKSKCHWI